MYSNVHQKDDIRKFIEVLFLIAMKLESTQILFAVERISKLCFVYTEIQKNKLLCMHNMNESQRRDVGQTSRQRVHAVRFRYTYSKQATLVKGVSG